MSSIPKDNELSSDGESQRGGITKEMLIGYYGLRFCRQTQNVLYRHYERFI